MTPAEEMGLKVGDKIRVLSATKVASSGGVCKGDVLRLREDDGSNNPYFFNESKNDIAVICVHQGGWEKVESTPTSLEKLKEAVGLKPPSLEYLTSQGEDYLVYHLSEHRKISVTADLRDSHIEISFPDYSLHYAMFQTEHIDKMIAILLDIKERRNGA